MGLEAQHGVVEPIDLPAAPPEDKELALAFQRGDKGAYQAIHDRYASRVHGVCRRMLISRDDAAEASQETFLRVYQALSRFNGRYQLQPWITRIATNVCLDVLRAKSRRPIDATTVEVENMDVIEAGDENDPEAIALRRTEGRRVRKILSGMPPMHRAAIVLRDFEGLSYQDIAVALGITEAQVKALLHRARTRFKNSWQTVGLAGLLPARLASRLRRLDDGASQGHTISSASQIAEAASPIAQVASSCSMVLHHCGQFVGERFATAVVGAVVAGAALGAGALNAGAPVQPGTERHELVSRADAHGKASHGSLPKKRRTRTPVTDKALGGAGAASPSPSPSASPSPEPQKTPESRPDETDPGGSSPGGEGPSSPTSVAIGWSEGQALPYAVPDVHVFALDCARWSLRQEIQTDVTVGSQNYPGEFRLTGSETTARLNLRLWVSGSSYDYSSWGPEPVAQWTENDGSTHVEINGEYGPLYGENPEDADLPGSGTFRGAITLDCTDAAVVTESIEFITE